MLEYIAVIAFGLLLGNFGTTLLYRLPRQISIAGFIGDGNGYRPICSSCQHSLKFYEYLPLISWITTKGRCNYCRLPINMHYWLLEFLSTLVSGICFYFFGLNDYYLIILFFSVLLFTQALIYLEHSLLNLPLNSVMLGTGLIYAALCQYTVLNAFISFLALLCFCMVLFKASPQAKRKEALELIAALLLASVWLENIVLLLITIMLFIMVYMVTFRIRRKNVMAYPITLIILFLAVFIQSYFSLSPMLKTAHAAEKSLTQIQPAALPAGFVYLADVCPQVKQNLMYASKDNRGSTVDLTVVDLKPGQELVWAPVSTS